MLVIYHYMCLFKINTYCPFHLTGSNRTNIKVGEGFYSSGLKEEMSAEMPESATNAFRHQGETTTSMVVCSSIASEAFEEKYMFVQRVFSHRFIVMMTSVRCVRMGES